ncbi:hypothetical protein EWB00_001792 [Schistosoma japonicum]|uniref:Uncharacterized protein n=1 Tax=Schistosoma japonicum TaxID=6182 RepID=A0A4Z2CJV4_SCHJA|nr:hypothetical protein EWB00_001792 [Schistosoma japonicum]
MWQSGAESTARSSTDWTSDAPHSVSQPEPHRVQTPVSDLEASPFPAEPHQWSSLADFCPLHTPLAEVHLRTLVAPCAQLGREAGRLDGFHSHCDRETEASPEESEGPHNPASGTVTLAVVGREGSSLCRRLRWLCACMLQQLGHPPSTTKGEGTSEARTWLAAPRPGGEGEWPTVEAP